MKQFVLSCAPDERGRVVLRGGDYRYLARVRRLAPGERFQALLPDGSRAGVLVCSVDGRRLVGEVVRESAGARSDAAPDSLPPIVLFQALPKGDKMDIVVRQATEGAVCEIVPFESEFSDARIGGRVGNKFARWERIVREARQQSGSATATVVRMPTTSDGLFLRWEEIRRERPGALGLIFHHLPLAKTSLHGYLGENPDAVVLAVGPEGGFSNSEVDRFVSAGFRPFTIGETVLRTETAALYAHAAIRILLLERDSWITR
jgi:16S rRNA (uracil1498-N3)-methyltransferase